MAGEKPDLKSAFSVRRNLRALFIRPDHHVGSVDGFRAFAILTIFAYHWLWSAQLLELKLFPLHQALQHCSLEIRAASQARWVQKFRILCDVRV